MRTCNAAYAVVALAAVSAPEQTPAQNQPRAPAPGSYGVSFGLPDGGGAGFGLRRISSPRANAGLDVLLDLNWSDFDRAAGPEEDPRTSFHLELIPNARLYKGSEGAVVLPFLLVGVRGSYTDASVDGWGVGAGAEVGLGVEWFPTTGVSVSGSTGARATYGHNSGQGGSVQGYIDVRGDLNISDESDADRTTIGLYLDRGYAILSNRLKFGEPVIVEVPLTEALSPDRLGTPGAMLQHVLAVCGGAI